MYKKGARLIFHKQVLDRVKACRDLWPVYSTWSHDSVIPVVAAWTSWEKADDRAVFLNTAMSEQNWTEMVKIISWLCGHTPCCIFWYILHLNMIILIKLTNTILYVFNI